MLAGTATCRAASEAVTRERRGQLMRIAIRERGEVSTRQTGDLSARCRLPSLRRSCPFGLRVFDLERQGATRVRLLQKKEPNAAGYKCLFQRRVL